MFFVLGDASVDRDWSQGHRDVFGFHLGFKPLPLLTSCLVTSCWEKLFFKSGAPPK